MWIDGNFDKSFNSCEKYKNTLKKTEKERGAWNETSYSLLSESFRMVKKINARKQTNGPQSIIQILNAEIYYNSLSAL